MIISERFISYQNTVAKVFEKAGLGRQIKNQKRIVIKPNLVVAELSPATTPIEIVAEVVKFCQKHSQAHIIIAEGSGGCDTQVAFQKLGYTDWAAKNQIELIDLNRAKRQKVSNPQAKALKKTKLPEILFDSFIINMPVLKEHSRTKMTCAMKNMVGIYLNSNAVLTKISWYNKSEIHLKGLYSSIKDLNDYIKSDFILVDASQGNQGLESQPRSFEPPIGQIVAGFDVQKVDRYCAELLNLDWHSIRYLG